MTSDSDIRKKLYDEAKKVQQESHKKANFCSWESALEQAAIRLWREAQSEMSKLFALNHVPCDSPKCLCQSKEFEEYWKGAGIGKRTSRRFGRWGIFLAEKLRGGNK